MPFGKSSRFVVSSILTLLQYLLGRDILISWAVSLPGSIILRSALETALISKVLYSAGEHIDYGVQARLRVRYEPRGP